LFQSYIWYIVPMPHKAYLQMFTTCFSYMYSRIDCLAFTWLT
jgi:hypothetical protein